MILLGYLHLMAPYTNHHVHILLSKMVYQKYNTVPLQKLHDPFFYSLEFLVSFGETLCLLLHMSVITFPLHTILGCLPMKNYMENFLIILHNVYLSVHALFYDLTLTESNCLQNFIYVYSWGMVLVKKDIEVMIRQVKFFIFLYIAPFYNTFLSTPFLFNHTT